MCHSIHYRFGSPVYGEMRSVPGVKMRIRDDLRKTVVFIGVTGDPQKGGIECLGTGFLLQYERCHYLVTAQHIAAGLGDNPFLVRFNRFDGHGDPADNIHFDPITDGTRWYCNVDDPNLDLAVMPFDYSLREGGYDCLFLPQTLIAGQSEDYNEIGIGDQCYTVGLFQLVAGTQRNLPVVHRGSVALLAGQDLVPVRDWLAPVGSNAVRYIDCHLVETQSLQGLSGSPVFARASIEFHGLPIGDGKKTRDAILAERNVVLFGIWQGSWDAPPGEVLSVAHRTGVRVPIGMGCVVPAQKLVELLETDELRMLRKERIKRLEAANAATPDMISPSSPHKADGDIQPGNPQHREDFNRLLNAAAQKPK